MSLYNMLFGRNPDSKEILGMLNLDAASIERFRDCWIDEEKGRIIILTRTGGGNRESFPNQILTENPHYISDEDDDFDSTYAYYYFSLPEKKE